jgi:hypothetical protein
LNGRTAEPLMSVRSSGGAISRIRWDYLIGFAVGVLTLTVYLAILRADFVQWDDDINLYANPNHGGLQADRLGWMWTDVQHVQRYKPLTWLTWSIVYEFFGTKAFGYHLINWLFHGANAMLLFFVLCQLFRGTDDSRHDQRLAVSLSCAGGALFWALHPMRVEAVAWASGLAYNQAVFFVLVSFLFHVRRKSLRASRQDSLLYWVSCAAFAGSMLSYPLAFGYVVLLLLFDLSVIKQAQSGRARLLEARRCLLEKLPFALIAIAVLCVNLAGRFHATGRWKAPLSTADFSLASRAAQSFYIWAYYVWKTWLPLKLSPLYLDLINFRPSEPRFVVSAVFILGTTLLFWWYRLRWRWALSLWLGYLVILVPNLGLTEYPHFPSDRYSMLVHLLWAVPITAGLCRLAVQPRRVGLVLAGTSCLLVAWTWLTVKQIGVWQNSEVFFRTMIAQLGSGPYVADSYYRLGRFYLIHKNYGAAVDSLQHALGVNPDSKTHFYLAEAFSEQGNLTGAIHHYSETLTLTPNYSNAHGSIGIALAMQGKLAEAIYHFEQESVLSSASADPHYNLALALSKNGQPERAQAELAIAHELGRNSIGAFRDAVALDSLSLAYGQQGKITEAGQCARQALELAIEAKSTALIDNIKRRLIDYEGAMKLD